MGLIDVVEVGKKFNGEILFENISFSLNKNDKLVIIGNNGVGKTTLLKMILKEIDIDYGSINILSNTSIGYLSQLIIHDYNNTLYQEVLLCFDDVLKLETKLKNVSKNLEENPSDATLIEEYGKLENKFFNMGGYDYNYKIDTILSKFGFNKTDYDKKMNQFSGGEKNKIAFAKLLLDHPDVLILDEPTNHLDMSTVEWLEDYIKNYNGSVIIVSHDRYFIDHTCNKVLEIFNKTSEIYKGNYSYYLNEKVNRYEQRLAQYNLQEKEIKHLEELIKKFKPKPTKVSFAKDREKKLQRILENKIEKPRLNSKKIHLKFNEESDIKFKQITLSDLEFGFSTPLSSKINLDIFNGDKIGIIGENGVGKTTLLKTIKKDLYPISGKVIEYRGITYGYIDQNSILISGIESIFDYVHNRFPYLTNFEVRHHLGSFLFSDEDIFKSIDNLSGGEKVRVVFACLLLSKYDILLLDEPTNHLDMETTKILESALREYEGTIIFITHDRYFLEELASKIIILHRDNLEIFEGSYNEYIESKNIETNQSNQVLLNKDTKMKNVPKKSNVSKIKLEEKIQKLTSVLNNLKDNLNKEEFYLDYQKMNDLENQIREKESELAKLEEEYLLIISSE